MPKKLVEMKGSSSSKGSQRVANPKSTITGTPAEERRIFAGFMSLWVISFRCRKATAEIRERKMGLAWVCERKGRRQRQILRTLRNKEHETDLGYADGEGSLPDEG